MQEQNELDALHGVSGLAAESAALVPVACYNVAVEYEHLGQQHQAVAEFKAGLVEAQHNNLPLTDPVVQALQQGVLGTHLLSHLLSRLLSHLLSLTQFCGNLSIDRSID